MTGVHLAVVFWVLRISVSFRNFMQRFCEFSILKRLIFSCADFLVTTVSLWNVIVH